MQGKLTAAVSKNNAEINRLINDEVVSPSYLPI
jgi:hypothetical protein